MISINRETKQQVDAEVDEVERQIQQGELPLNSDTIRESIKNNSLPDHPNRALKDELTRIKLALSDPYQEFAEAVTDGRKAEALQKLARLKAKADELDINLHAYIPAVEKFEADLENL